MAIRIKDQSQLGDPRVIIFCVDTRVFGQKEELYQIYLDTTRQEIKHFCNYLAQRVSDDDNLFVSLISMKNSPESLLKPSRFDLPTIHQRLTNLELSIYDENNNPSPETDVLDAVLKYLDRIHNSKRSNTVVDQFQHRFIYITPHMLQLTNGLKEKFTKLDEHKVLVDIGVVKLFDDHDLASNVHLNSSFTLFVRQLFYANMVSIDAHPLCTERFFKQILCSILMPSYGTNQVSIKFGYSSEYNQSSNLSASQNILYNPVEHGDFTILSITCAVSPSILDVPTFYSSSACRCHKAKTIEKTEGLANKKRHYCSVNSLLSDRELVGPRVNIGQQSIVLNKSHLEKKNLATHLSIMKRVPIQSQADATIFGNTFILTHGTEYDVMDWEAAKRNKQHFFGLCQSLLQKMEVLIAKSNLDIVTNTTSEINRFYVLTPSTNGNALLLQSIATADQIVPYNIDISLPNEMISSSLPVIDAALSQIPCQEFNPFECNSGYNSLCEEYISKIIQPTSTNVEDMNSKKKTKRTVLTITSKGVVYSEPH